MKWIYFTHHDNNYISKSLLDKTVSDLYILCSSEDEREKANVYLACEDNTELLILQSELDYKEQSYCL